KARVADALLIVGRGEWLGVEAQIGGGLRGGRSRQRQCQEDGGNERARRSRWRGPRGFLHRLLLSKRSGATPPRATRGAGSLRSGEKKGVATLFPERNRNPPRTVGS